MILGILHVLLRSCPNLDNGRYLVDVHARINTVARDKSNAVCGDTSSWDAGILGVHHALGSPITY